LHWNQEQGPSLFGFATEAEKVIFLLLIDCPGVGPKIGLAVLAHMTPATFLRAIQSGNDEALSQVNGIGAKKAEHLIVHLKHKVAKLIEAGLDAEEGGQANQWQTVIEALNALNYSRPEINRALKHLHESYADKTYAFDQLLRQALSFLSKKQ
jgi:Holliday junction DNA helicase RuvA